MQPQHRRFPDEYCIVWLGWAFIDCAEERFRACYRIVCVACALGKSYISTRSVQVIEKEHIRHNSALSKYLPSALLCISWDTSATQPSANVVALRQREEDVFGDDVQQLDLSGTPAL
jgi:hypothetical protein